MFLEISLRTEKHEIAFWIMIKKGFKVCRFPSNSRFLFYVMSKRSVKRNFFVEIFFFDLKTDCVVTDTICSFFVECSVGSCARIRQDDFTITTRTQLQSPNFPHNFQKMIRQTWM